jgi:hypothetical protein
MMADATLVDRALGDEALCADVIQHGRLAFPSGWAKFDEAEQEQLSIVPDGGLRDVLRCDYAKMAEMILGDAPAFEWVMGKIDEIARRH